MTKREKITKKNVEDNKLSLDIAQKVAFNSVLSTLFPQHILNSVGFFSDPDEVLNLIYAGTNHLDMRFKSNGLNNLGNPIEMKIRVKYDPNIDEIQLGFSFLQATFTIYIPEDISEDINISSLLGDQLMSQLVDRLPSAEARLVLTISEVCSQGGRNSYIQRFLPKKIQSASKKKLKGNQRRKQRTLSFIQLKGEFWT